MDIYGPNMEYIKNLNCSLTIEIFPHHYPAKLEYITRFLTNQPINEIITLKLNHIFILTRLRQQIIILSSSDVDIGKMIISVIDDGLESFQNFFFGSVKQVKIHLCINCSYDFIIA